MPQLVSESLFCIIQHCSSAHQINKAVAMALTGSNFEGIYASPQSSRSGSFSELGLTLLPSSQSGLRRERLGFGGLQSEPNEGPQTFDGRVGAFSYPSPTPTLGSLRLDRPHDLPKHDVNVSNGGISKQSLSTVTDRQLHATPLFVHLRSIDRSGRVSNDALRPTYLTPLQYRPSAPHLHTLVSTGITLAAATQLDLLKERNKHLTMERDRFYYLSKPATRRADDGKSQQIRDLRAELKALSEQNHKLRWALENQTARAQDAYLVGSSYKAQFEAIQAAYNTLVTSNSFIPSNEPIVPLGPPIAPADAGVQRPSAYIDLTSPKKPCASQQVGPLKRTSASAATTPVMMTEGQPPAPPKKRPSSSSATATPSTTTEPQPPPPQNGPVKRQRKDSNAEKQPRKQQSMLNGSQMYDIQARLRHELKGKTASYAWAQEIESNEVKIRDGLKAAKRADIVRERAEGESNEVEIQNFRGVEAAIPADIAGEEAEDELSESEIAAFDRALLEDLDEAGEEQKNGGGGGDGDSIFGDG